MKILFYISSLMPLSFLIFLKLWNLENCLSFLCSVEFYCYFGIPFIACCFLALICYVKVKINKQSAESFTEIQLQNFNFFVPLSIYFIPFVSSNFNSINDWLITIFIILFMGIITIKMDLQYLNPLVAVFGFKLYRAKIERKNKEVFILSTGKLPNQCEKNYNCITDNLYYIKEKK
ncbi:MAG: hypothetical protein J1E31_02345 [Helicobacter sp.]|nr:hypothetical protein [Helicobacter sp.]